MSHRHELTFVITAFSIIAESDNWRVLLQCCLLGTSISYNVTTRLDRVQLMSAVCYPYRIATGFARMKQTSTASDFRITDFQKSALIMTYLTVRTHCKEKQTHPYTSSTNWVSTRTVNLRSHSTVDGIDRYAHILPGRHILENYTGNTRVFGVEVVYFLRKYTVYFQCNSRVPTEITRITRDIATPQWRNDGEITLNC